MSIFESDKDKELRLLQEVSDRLSEQSSHAEWSAMMEQSEREQAQRDAEQRHREVLRAQEDEKDRPHREAVARRVLTDLLADAGLQDPFVVERFRRDHKGYSIEEAGWQKFANDVVLLGRFANASDESLASAIHSCNERLEETIRDDLRADPLASEVLNVVQRKYASVLLVSSERVAEERTRRESASMARREQELLEEARQQRQNARLTQGMRGLKWSGLVAVASFITCVGSIFNGGDGDWMKSFQEVLMLLVLGGVVAFFGFAFWGNIRVR
jgi:hypothetical protein